MTDERAVDTAIIRLMQGVVYRESDEDTWLILERSGARIRDHFATIGVELVVDDNEGMPTCGRARRSRARRRCLASYAAGR